MSDLTLPSTKLTNTSVRRTNLRNLHQGSSGKHSSSVVGVALHCQRLLADLQVDMANISVCFSLNEFQVANCCSVSKRSACECCFSDMLKRGFSAGNILRCIAR